MQKFAIGEQIPFPNSHGMVWAGSGPKGQGHLSLFHIHEGIWDDYPKSVEIPILVLPVHPEKQQNIHLGNVL